MYRKRIYFALITVVLVFGMMEVGLRIASFGRGLFGGDENVADSRLLLSVYKDKKWAEIYWREFREQGFDFAQYVMWSRREYHGHYLNNNSRGVRQTWNPKIVRGSRAASIYMFGGSALWGTGVRDNYTIPSHVSRMLHDRGYNANVHNYGVSSYIFTQEILRLILLLRDGIVPDYVIFYDGFNDVSWAYESGRAGTVHRFAEMKGMFEGRIRKRNAVREFLTGTRTYEAYRKILAYFLPPKKGGGAAARYTDRELQRLSRDVVDHYAESAVLLDKLSGAYGFKYLLIWQPSIFAEDKLTDEEVRANQKFADPTPFSRLHKYTLDALKAEHIPHFFNFSNALAGRTKSYYIDACHLTEDGNEKIAAEIVSILEREYLHKNP